MALKRYSVGHIGDFKDRPMIGLTLDGTDVVVFHADGQYYALEDRCSHADFKLSDGECNSEFVTCPAHGAEFCIKTGKALCMPAFTPVRSFPVLREGDELFVELDDVAG